MEDTSLHLERKIDFLGKSSVEDIEYFDFSIDRISNHKETTAKLNDKIGSLLLDEYGSNEFFSAEISIKDFKEARQVLVLTVAIKSEKLTELKIKELLERCLSEIVTE